MKRRDAASEAQVQAADPQASTWLSANAGSGKTRVLTDRVARLLLRGVLPQRILCLTYTKAAASEMQNRLFKRLGAWAMLADDALQRELENLGVERNENTAPNRARARTLFARAIEAPGGLKIQTIHSFCAALLRRFPLEAGISPQFTEMDARAVRRLSEDILEDMAGADDPQAFDGIAQYLSGAEDAAHKFLAEISKRRAALAAPVTRADIWARFDLAADAAPADALRIAFDGSEEALFGTAIAALRSIGGMYEKIGGTLAAIDPQAPALTDLEVLFSLCIYQSGDAEGLSKSSNFPQSNHKNAVAGFAHVAPEFHAFMDRVTAARDYLLALETAQRTLALHRFAHSFLPRLDAAKLSRAWLDFDDLILKARDLLTAPEVAQWVLFRLDGGIDHLLVDEAQDTSPAQWEVIALLAREFTAGLGARADVQRTIFVVGDPKQSIYSFQGADPGAFDKMRQDFATALEQINDRLNTRQLAHSFRSAASILALVDHTFRDAAAVGVERDIQHIAFHDTRPGRIDLWPVIAAVKPPPDPDWTDTVDAVPDTHHNVQLAARIAGEITRLIGTPIPAKGGGARPIRAGDFLILVQRRSDLFAEVIRACKAAGLPIAGADRLKVGAEMAVKDLRALLAFLATPEDSLALATALRSPLLGMSEAALFKLAAGRSETHLWATLRNQKTEHAAILAILNDLRDQADYLRPYDLIERLLTRHDGRRRLLARLGAEAEDGIDALLSQALAYERSEVPSLTGFLGWMDTDDLEIKRQPDSAGNRIRVMTVHGAKGLEAPIVILPDTAKRQLRDGAALLDMGEKGIAWRAAKPQSPPAVRAAIEDNKARQEEERRRLLYVAMTRAESWLIVCAAGDTGNDLDSWHNTVARGMQGAGAVTFETPWGEAGQRFANGNWPEACDAQPPSDTVTGAPLPAWAQTPAPVPVALPKPRSPSELGGAKAMPDDADPDQEQAALRRGRQMHLLLEHLPEHPQAQWPAIAQNLLGSGADAATPQDITALLAEAAGVLRAPELAALFAPDALSEVTITAPVNDLNAPVLGAIDRLIITKDRVLAVDFKTNRLVPDHPEMVPEGLLRQMGAYAAALAQIYPDHRIETAILWTIPATLMPLPHEIVRNALRRAPIS